MSAPKTPSQSILTWLRANGMQLGVLTSQDTHCLRAAVEIANCWVLMGGEDRNAVAAAFGTLVLRMQPEAQYLAYHGIAMVGDWGHRAVLWRDASLLSSVLEHCPECKFGPKRARCTSPDVTEGGAS